MNQNEMKRLFSPEEMEMENRAFLADYPDYERTAVLDDLREREFSRLDRMGHVYVDYTGGGLFGESQIRDHMKFLSGSVLGNPTPPIPPPPWLPKGW